VNKLTFQIVPLLIKLDHPHAKCPVQEEGNVGFDVFSVNETDVLPPGRVTKVPLGLRLAENPEPLIVDRKTVAVPFLKIEGRSGLASKGIFPVGGIVDPNYRGEISVMLFNSTTSDYIFEQGDRVAQFVCYYTLSNTEETKVRFWLTDSVTETTRGDRGFGSSGK
jgi:dUTP pyrophosphatase